MGHLRHDNNKKHKCAGECVDHDRQSRLIDGCPDRLSENNFILLSAQTSWATVQPGYFQLLYSGFFDRNKAENAQVSVNFTRNRSTDQLQFPATASLMRDWYSSAREPKYWPPPHGMAGNKGVTLCCAKTRNAQKRGT